MKKKINPIFRMLLIDTFILILSCLNIYLLTNKPPIRIFFYRLQAGSSYSDMYFTSSERKEINMNIISISIGFAILLQMKNYESKQS